ncbi:MAG TPA: hypothetical protein VJ418_18155 [Streptosporangiaceae bacterium]|nr:hypothetical protein [Streptosporangiaceae bacterium]
MARDHVVERALQDREVHRAGDADCGDQDEPAAERSAVVALVQGDEPFLGERQRVPLRFLVQRERGFRHCRHSFACLLPSVSHEVEPADHVTDPGRLEQVGHRYPDAVGGAGPPGQHHGLDRAAAVLDDRDAGEPGKSRQGCSDFTDAFGIH